MNLPSEAEQEKVDKIILWIRTLLPVIPEGFPKEILILADAYEREKALREKYEKPLDDDGLKQATECFSHRKSAWLYLQKVFQRAEKAEAALTQVNEDLVDAMQDRNDAEAALKEAKEQIVKALDPEFIANIQKDKILLEATQRLNHCEAERDKLSATLEQAIEEDARWHKQVSELVAERDKLYKELRGLQIRYDDLAENVDNHSIERLTKELSELKESGHRNCVHRHELAELKAFAQEMQRQAKQAGDRIDELEKELAKVSGE